jgi:hypothetical protein
MPAICGIFEAADLIVSSEQVEDRIEDQIDQAITPTSGCAAHVAERNLKLRSAGLGM